jgi:hypothetical protein
MSIALAATLVATAFGCAQEERTFTAEEFVGEVRAEGVEIELGEELSTAEADADLRAVELVPLPGAPPVPGEGAVGGSLAVYEKTGAAEDRLGECQAAADLLCYRAANVVVILERGGIEAQRLGVAMQRLAE